MTAEQLENGKWIHQKIEAIDKMLVVLDGRAGGPSPQEVKVFTDVLFDDGTISYRIRRDFEQGLKDIKSDLENEFRQL